MKEVRLDRIFREVKDLIPVSETELLTPSVVHGVVPQSSLGMRPQQASRDGYSVAPAQPDDFVISLSSHAHGFEWCGLYGGVSPDYTLLRPIIDIRYVGYLKYALKSPFMISQLALFKTGIRMGLRLQWSRVRYCKIDLPTLDEATALSDHLDRATARIDALVAKKTRFIELLREKRQALITLAVTRGLDPSVPMKDSGVEWLGEVPKHWKVMMLRRAISSFEQGWSPDCDARPAESDEWGVMKSSCVNGGVFNEAENKVLPTRFDPRPGLEIQDGDVLMSRASGSPSLIGSAAYVSDPRPKLMISDKIFRLVTTPETDGRFLVFALGSSALRRQIEQAIGGAEGLANNLSQSSIKSLWLTFPSVEEQRMIVAHLGRAVARIDSLITKTERSMELLREHRTAVIAAAVTGKIDLRSAA